MRHAQKASFVSSHRTSQGIGWANRTAYNRQISTDTSYRSRSPYGHCWIQTGLARLKWPFDFIRCLRKCANSLTVQAGILLDHDRVIICILAKWNYKIKTKTPLLSATKAYADKTRGLGKTISDLVFVSPKTGGYRLGCCYRLGRSSEMSSALAVRGGEMFDEQAQVAAHRAVSIRRRNTQPCEYANRRK